MDQSISTEEKITGFLALMKEELANVKGPNFKTFWDHRKEALGLFKENLAPQSRAKLWAHYLTIADEARMAKDHLEEDAKFASEQLELAIAALEKESSHFIAHQESALGVELIAPKALEAEVADYSRLQGKIQVLFIFASKVTELREELIKIPMRMKLKAKYFDRLSSLGDQIFPLRKSLIVEVSSRFMQDVERFAAAYFSETTFDAEKMKRSIFFFREEIKRFQAFGHALSLQGSIFASSRKQLSFCWDQLKGMEKELKKEFADQKVKSSENALTLREKMAACAERGLSLEALREEISSIQALMRRLPLVKTDVIALKEELIALARPLHEQEEKEQEERSMQAAQEEALRLARYEEFLAKIERCKSDLESVDSCQTLQTMNDLKKELTSLSVVKIHKQQLQQELKLLTEQFAELKEKRLLSLSADDQNALSTLKAALEEKQAARKESKHQMECYRKKKGSCGLDFEKALELEELLEVERTRLEKLDQVISEIKEKISDIT